MSTSFAVAQARATLADAESAQREERRKQLITKLAETREALRLESAALDKMRADVLALQAIYDGNRRSLELLDDLLGLHQQARPAVAEYLPADPQVVAWSSKERDLRAERARVLNQRLGLPNLALMRLDGAQLAKRVQELMFGEGAILNELEGMAGQFPPGGVFAPQ